jgi:hypothetical protein
MPFKKIFSKKNAEPKSKYDILNMKVTDLRVGFMFDYDMSNWIVDAEYEYDWGNEYFTKEFKITNGIDIKYLSIDSEDQEYVSIVEKIKLRQIDINLPEYIIEHQKPPKEIMFNNTKFLLEEENPGYFKDLGNDDQDWIEFLSWDYEDYDNNVITIEQWGDKSFEAAIGKYIKNTAISNILPQ